MSADAKDRLGVTDDSSSRTPIDVKGPCVVIGPSESTETDDTRKLQVSSVSSFWLPKLVEIDSTWNPRHWSAQLFARELTNRFARVKGLFEGDQLIGYLIGHVALDEGHIVSFGIAPSHRRRGAGEFLLREFLRAVASEGVRVLTLDVRDSNLVAQRLYAKVGFVGVGVRRRYYSDNGEDALTMRLELPA